VAIIEASPALTDDGSHTTRRRHQCSLVSKGLQYPETHRLARRRNIMLTSTKKVHRGN